ncbi:glycoside hydrolase family 95 protein [Pelagicoccus mobilis]|uniref:Glycoside hydrolase family 95 protein n=1 Tax=Pelagicoccus mobilis TaxID=415221 RepID=A0A934VPG5_9BACT|nr:glycoside hydrolase family 95 protein [Pelagicoccus mobilis]MBK1875795.1 glycoside hydrolase family 95 protein [Pelagicoccus mobilis]
MRKLFCTIIAVLWEAALCRDYTRKIATQGRFLQIGFVTLAIAICFGHSLSADRFKLNQNAKPDPKADLMLWYEEPAGEWVESLPIGNGRLLATNQGGVRHEIIQLNEDTIWSGKIVDWNREEAYEALQESRRLIFEGEYAKAQKLVNEDFSKPHHAHGVQTYQTLGDLHLYLEYGDKTLHATDYRRELDLDEAISSVSYKVDGATYTRELFSSAVDQAIVVRLSCDQPGKISFDAVFSRPEAKVEAVAKDLLVISGTATDRGNPNSGGVSYESQIQLKATGGKLTKVASGLGVKEADEVELRIVVATDYHGDNPSRVCKQQLKAIKGKSHDAIRDDHIKEHQRLFRRVELKLPLTKKPRRLANFRHGFVPTDQRIEALRQGVPDPGLFSLYFQFGRYLLISSSRPGTQAVNLWGKWINTIDPWFNADYHTNINIQMNYWPAQVGNLAECHTPFFDLIDELRPQGRVTAQKVYKARGFVAHHATDAWRYTAPVGRATHGMWVMTPAWGAYHMWLHYLYTEDRDYLSKKTYPVMKEAAEFIADYLVVDPRTGNLTTGPSTSPENSFIAPNGDKCSISMGPSMDLQLVEALFKACIEASEVLGKDADFREELEGLLARLQPLQIGEDGRLMEWSLPFKETEPEHKHVAHLWAMCESSLITPQDTPELFEASLKSLDFRVEHGSDKTPVFRGNTGWIAQAYARLLEGDKAYDVLEYLIADSSYSNLFATSVQGLRREMWETDANLGCTATIAELFMQSYAGYIELLPALPEALNTGSVKGLSAQGGFDVDLEWAKGKLVSATIHSKNGNPCRVKLGDRIVEFDTDAGKSYAFDANLNRK